MRPEGRRNISEHARDSSTEMHTINREVAFKFVSENLKIILHEDK